MNTFTNGFDPGLAPESDNSDFDMVGNPMSTLTRFVMVLVLDLSGSMGAIVQGLSQSKIEQLRSVVENWITSAASMDELKDTLDIAAIGFGGDVAEPLSLGIPTVLDGMTNPGPFTKISEAHLPALTPHGATPMGRGVQLAVQIARARRMAVVGEASGTTYRPTIVLVTDGLPTDAWESMIPDIRSLEAEKRLLLYCVGVDGADFDTLRRIAPNATYACDVRFDQLTAMLSASAASGASNASAKSVYDTVASALSGLGIQRS